MENCCLCPRNCRADRVLTNGRCGMGRTIHAARAALHHWEEPCISGSGGSGTIFFSGCPLGCVFCQNYTISSDNHGRELTAEKLSGIMLSLQKRGAHNINLVNPTHFLPEIEKAYHLAYDALHIPVISNSSGYESIQTIARYSDMIDIYLPDLKFFNAGLSARYCGAPDYFQYASKALPEMFRYSGPPVFNKSGLLMRGLCIRHLVMPGCARDTQRLLRWLADTFPSDGIIISLMCQYIPAGRAAAYPEINRRLTTYEYHMAMDTLYSLGFQYIYTQQRSAASPDFIPAFDGEGLC